MNIRIRYFAAAVEAAGCDEEELFIAADPTLGSLVSVLEKRYGPDRQKVLNDGRTQHSVPTRRQSARNTRRATDARGDGPDCPESGSCAHGRGFGRSRRT